MAQTVFSSAEVVFVDRQGRARSANGTGDSYKAMAEDAWAGLHPDLPMPSEIDYEVHMQNIQGPLGLPDSYRREVCVRCGMVANVDPFMHTERYAHRPIVIRNGRRWQFSQFTGAFTILFPDE